MLDLYTKKNIMLVRIKLPTLKLLINYVETEKYFLSREIKIKL